MKKSKCFVIILSLLLLSGCWDSKDLDERSMVGGIGIDINSITKNYKVVSQVVPSEAAKAALAGTSSGNSELIWNITTEGETVVEALFKTIAITGRDPSFSHTRVIVFSENLAKEGIEEAMDFLRRSEEIRRNAWILITNEDMEDVFNSENKLTIIPSYGLGTILDEGNTNANIAAVNLHEFGKKASCESSSPYAPIIEIYDMGTKEAKNSSKSQGENSGSNNNDSKKEETEKKELIIKNTAVFHDFKLVGKLNEKETRGLMWVNNDIRSTIAAINSPNNQDKKLDIVINMFKSSVEPSKVAGDIVMKIKVNAEGFISENHDPDLATSKPDVIKQIAENLNKVIEDEITSVIKKAQSLRVDIFDFGDSIYKNYPNEWKKIKDNWRDEFQKINYEIEFKTNIKSGGRIETDGK